MKVTEAEYVTENFSVHLQVYTGDFIQRKSHSATAAFTIPTLNLNWNGKLVNLTSLTMTEVAAITEALGMVLQIPVQDVVILRDLRTAIRQLLRPSSADGTTA